MNYYTLDQWRSFARTGFILQSDDDRLFIYNNNEFIESMQKPPNWRTLLDVVNGRRDPIRPMLRNAIFALFQGKEPIDARDPWPVLGRLKDNKQLNMVMHDPHTIIVERLDTGKTDVVDTFGADAICARWNRIGCEHERIILFSAIIDPTCVDYNDPWLHVMQMRQRDNLRLVFDAGNIVVLNGSATVRSYPSDMTNCRIDNLVRMFNAGEVPPGCITAWDPCYSVQEAMHILKVIYGTADFSKLRVERGKLRRSP
jgi:hypothetical protein